MCLITVIIKVSDWLNSFMRGNISVAICEVFLVSLEPVTAHNFICGYVILLD